MAKNTAQELIKTFKKMEREKIIKPVKKPKKSKPSKPAKLPQVKKKTEYEWMIELIRRGLWRTTNLASVIGIDRETVDKWKKRPEVMEERRKVIWATLGKRGRGRGTETILKEMGVETDPDKLEITHKFEELGDDELDNLIASKARQVGAAGAIAGERAPKDGGAS